MPPTPIKGDVDLEGHFFRIRLPLMWTFLLFTLTIVLDGPLLETEQLLQPVRVLHGVWLLAAVLGIISRNRVVHVAIAATILATSILLVVTRFWVLV